MAKFCKYCGTQLNDDQVCTCPEAQAAAQPAAQPAPEVAPQAAPQAAPAAPSPFSIALKNLVPFLKAYLRSPVNATRAVIAQKDFLLAIILLAIQAIAVGLVIFSFLHKLCGVVREFVLAAMGLGGMTSSSLFGGFSGPAITASFPLCLIYGIVCAIIVIAIFTVLLFAVAKIMKSTCSFKDVLTACGANSPFATVLYLLAFILFFVSIKLGLIALLFATLAWLIMSVPTVQAVTPGTEQGKFWISCIVAVLIAMLAGGWVSSKFVGMSAKATRISFEGESATIGQAMEAAGEIDLDQILENFMYEIF